ncbi:MAG: DUF6350 family protein [Candidatus Nanopelagicales bacterium]
MWRSGPLPVPVAGVAAGLWASLTGLVITVVLTLVVWIFAAGESASDTALRVGADVWLAGHGTPFRVGTGVWTLMPWAWVVFPGVTLWAAGRWLAHRAAVAYVKSAAVAAAALATTYAVVALLAALYGTMSSAAAIPMRAFLHAGLIAFLVSFTAILWRAGLLRGAMERTWQLARPAVAAFAVLVLGACVAMIVATIAGYSALTATVQEIRPGAVGGIALFVAWLGYLPAALLWCLSFVLGAGIQVGGVPVTPLQPLGAPVDMLGLNVLPVTANPAWLIGAVIPVAAGLVLNRIAGPATTRRAWWQVRGVALAVLLIVVDLWWFISTGRLGDGRLDLLGPPPVLIPVLLGAVVLGIAGDVAFTWAWRRWGHRATVDLTEGEPSAVDEDVPA